MRRAQSKSGFTLVEIMIVVAIIALLAVIAVPAFMRARQRSQNAKVMNALRVAAGAVEIYAIEHHSYPPDVNRGIVPPGLASYLDPTFDWVGPTPVGGRWDWDFNVSSIKAAISIVEPTAPESQLEELDQQYDDGDLQGGRFQRSGLGRYSDIIER